MGRKLVLDANVVDQINRGNADAADALSKMRRNGDTVYVSQQAYNELVTQPAIPRTGAANKEFLKDANIEIAPAGPMAARVDVYAGNQTKTGTVLSEEDARVAAQAAAIGAEIWSFDRAYRNNANAVRNLGVKVAPECTQIDLVSGQTPADYRVGRRLMSFAPIEVSVSGYVTRTGPSGGKGGVYSASVGVPEGLPEVGGPSQRGQAIVGGIVLVLEGINIVLNIINDNIQKKKANDALDKERSAIGQARSSRPTEGILLLFYYTQADPGDSIIKPGASFNYMLWGQGATHDEALQDALKTPGISAGTSLYENKFDQEVWIPPLQKPQLTQAKMAFPPVGQARFFLGNSSTAIFQLVKFNTLEGFDDIVEKKLDLPSGRNADFVVLQPPAEIYWFNLNGKQTTKVPLKQATTANDNTITVVDLDPWSPFSAAAAMVFPVDDWAENVFSYIGPTEDAGGTLNNYINFRMIRWVRAENIHLLKFF